MSTAYYIPVWQSINYNLTFKTKPQAYYVLKEENKACHKRKKYKT